MRAEGSQGQEAMHEAPNNRPRRRVFTGEGVWQGEDGSRFAFTLELEARDHRCEGAIRWAAVATPRHPALRKGPHETGTEYVRGTLDESGRLQLYGYRLDNPVLLSLDEYKLWVAPDEGSFEGTSRGPWGTWRNVLAGRLRAA
jgi:hypothetical protein